MYIVIDKLVELLGLPTPVLAADRIGARRPAMAGDVPAIACGVVVSDTKGRGIGRFIGSKHVPVQLTTRVQVSASGDAFSGDLRTLRLVPPMRREPAPTSHTLTERDVGVINVTNPAQPAVYRLVARPENAAEYRADLVAALIRFGAPQRVGDTLEVSYWTVEWHEPTESDLMRGTIALELWTADVGAIRDLARRVEDRLTLRGPARERGFVRLEPARLEPAAGATHVSSTGASFPAWTQRIEYAFTFEGTEVGATSDGGIIRRIDANLDGGLSETLAIPAT
jgi:hypothetical protein